MIITFYFLNGSSCALKRLQSNELCLLLQIREGITQLLNTVLDIYKYMEWSDVEQRIKDDPGYMMIREVVAYQDT